VSGSGARIPLALLALAAACSSGEQRLLDRAEERRRAGSYDEAIRLNTLLYERDPDGKRAAQALFNIGNIHYLNLRRIPPAIEAYDRLAREFPGTRLQQEAQLSLARIYENEIGDFSQAVAQYNRLLEEPDLQNRREIEVMRANAYFMRQDYHNALRELRRLEEAGIDGHLGHKVFLKIGSIYQIEKKYETAITYFLRVADAPCQECRRQAILSLAACHEAVFDFAKAREALARLDDTPENRRLIADESARLQDKEKRVNSQPAMEWRGAHR